MCVPTRPGADVLGSLAMQSQYSVARGFGRVLGPTLQHMVDTGRLEARPPPEPRYRLATLKYAACGDDAGSPLQSSLQSSDMRGAFDQVHRSITGMVSQDSVLGALRQCGAQPPADVTVAQWTLRSPLQSRDMRGAFDQVHRPTHEKKKSCGVTLW